MNSNENIHNAFYVVAKTYENVNKLLNFCRANCSTQSHYVQAVDNFLRFKSDSDVTGWLIRNFIVLFQDANAQIFDNGWRDGPIYVLEIDFLNYDKSLDANLPLIRLSKYTYDNLENWSPGCSPTHHKRFYNPLRDHHLFQFEQVDDTLTGVSKNNDGADKQYWGLRTMRSKSFPLSSVTSENAIDLIFGTFDSL